MVPPVAPDAPDPTYDARGNLVAEWTVSIRYDAVRDDLVLHCAQEAGPYNKAKVQTDHFAPDEIEDLLVLFLARVRIMGARRLF